MSRSASPARGSTSSGRSPASPLPDLRAGAKPSRPRRRKGRSQSFPQLRPTPGLGADHGVARTERSSGQGGQHLQHRPCATAAAVVPRTWRSLRPAPRYPLLPTRAPAARVGLSKGLGEQPPLLLLLLCSPGRAEPGGDGGSSRPLGQTRCLKRFRINWRTPGTLSLRYLPDFSRSNLQSNTLAGRGVLRRAKLLRRSSC